MFMAGDVPDNAIRSVVGTIDIADDDPDLEKADEYLRGLVHSSLSRPYLAREGPPSYDAPAKGRKARRRG